MGYDNVSRRRARCKLEIWDCVQGQKRERQVGDREAVQLSPAFMNPAAD